ncbi:hypothetical protein AALA79_13575 [Lachnospiraceae bacterium 64-25]|nr:hypothetical protein IMSAGC005_02739 [Lachnospiraceae bacterium]
MMDEKKFDYENYIQNRLREIDDLDERRFAKELLLNGLGSVFAWTEAKYEALEQRVQKELDFPGRRFYVYMTIAEKKDYDPINTFWFPVCGEDVADKRSSTYRTVYLMADEKERRAFQQKESVEGILKESGKRVSFQIRRSARYLDSMKRLYSLFVLNHIPWQGVHMGHLERFFDLIAPEGLLPDAEVEFLWDGWEKQVREDMIPLWNIERTAAGTHEYRMPCIDEVFYEHFFYLSDGTAWEDGCLIDTGDDILSVRYEQNKVVLKTRQQSLKDIAIYRMHQEEPAASFGYRYPVLSNVREDHLAARYLHQAGNFLQTPLELGRKVKELAGEYEVALLGYELLDREKGTAGVDGILFGDMNAFTGVQVFSEDQRNILLMQFQKRGSRTDYLYESQVRYILSQLQAEFMEYRCAGVMVEA